MAVTDKRNSPQRRLRQAPVTMRQQADNQAPAKARRARHVPKLFAMAGRGFKTLARPFRFLRRPLRRLAIIFGLRYLVRSWRELRTVTWPNWRTTRQLTQAVIIFAVIFGALIAGVDYGLDKLFKLILQS